MDLLKIPDIARLCGVSVRTVRDRWIHQPDFPAPTLAPTSRSRQWSRESIIAWASPGARRSVQATPGSTYSAASTGLDAR